MDSNKTRPEPVESAPVQSLADRLGAAARAGAGAARARFGTLGTRRTTAAPPVTRRDWAVAALVAVLIAAGPLATLVGAKLLAAQARSQGAALRDAAAPRLARAQEHARARAALGDALRRPALGTTLEALARALPEDATLARVERGADGLLEVDVRTPDPDQLRTALHRLPGMVLREAGQARDGARIRVTLREVRG